MRRNRPRVRRATTHQARQPHRCRRGSTGVALQDPATGFGSTPPCPARQKSLRAERQQRPFPFLHPPRHLRPRSSLGLTSFSRISSDPAAAGTSRCSALNPTPSPLYSPSL